MVPATAAEVCGAVRGTLCGDASRVISNISTDSRTTGPGDWFVPLSGERFDGHDYIDKALDAGGVGCFCARLPENLRPDKTYILVQDTKTALRDLASWYRGQFDLPVIQITGSMGKTTLKELLAGILSQRFCTLKTPGNLNGDIGAPLTLLSLKPEHQALVIETGMDEFGQIRWLGEAIRPDIAMITNIDDVHLSHFSSRKDILKAKAEIFENLRPGGLALLNGDDELLNTLRPDCETLFCGFGGFPGVSYHTTAENFQWLDMESFRTTIVTQKDRYDLTVPSPASHMAGHAALAVTAAERLGLTKEEIIRGAAAYAPADNRLRLEHLPGGRVMINDSYNANPTSVRADVSILARHPGRKIALLGDMTELGSAEESGHQRVGTWVGRRGIDVLLAVGPRSKQWMIPAAEEAGCPDVRWFEDREAVKAVLPELFGPGDALLLKASHFFGRFDLLADYLRQYPF
ncbi:MAG: UDP-N-acetylmuramoyl-tripeptide--D-alanyl-D-alanine ligase [Oscillospiraceae bacterium]|nr:UDP-N-acetylmuramoyl-tripeptide--D-alanyl-D-alanine ligase [Oscillospiraceae bacterium]